MTLGCTTMETKRGKCQKDENSPADQNVTVPSGAYFIASDIIDTCMYGSLFFAYQAQSFYFPWTREISNDCALEIK